MADKVVRLRWVYTVRQERNDGFVVLTVEGETGGKQIRVEMRMDPTDLANAITAIRDGATSQRNRWAAVLDELQGKQ